MTLTESADRFRAAWEELRDTIGDEVRPAVEWAGFHLGLGLLIVGAWLAGIRRRREK